MAPSSLAPVEGPFEFGHLELLHIHESLHEPQRSAGITVGEHPSEGARHYSPRNAVTVLELATHVRLAARGQAFPVFVDLAPRVAIKHE